MVGQRTLTPLIVVRIHVAQPIKKTPHWGAFLFAELHRVRATIVVRIHACRICGRHER